MTRRLCCTFGFVACICAGALHPTPSLAQSPPTDLTELNLEEILSLDIVVEKVLLNLDRVIPCGLMVNELISNALKYAFSDGKKGEILVQMGHVDQDVLLVVKDDGVGLPEDMDIRTSTSLGMQLINTLVRQLDGDLELVNAQGTEVRVCFPLEKRSV